MSSLEKRLTVIRANPELSRSIGVTIFSGEIPEESRRQNVHDRFSDSESDSESSIGSSFPSSAPTPLAKHSTGMFPSLFRGRNETQHKYSREPHPTPPPPQPPKLTRNDTPRYSYDKVMFEVRNMQVLSPQQMMYVRTLPKDKILELLDIYNQIMVNVNEVFS